MNLNPELTLSIFAWVVAQILKVIVALAMKQKIEVSYILSSGGMPSSHAAFTCACAFSVGRTCGWSSSMFAVAVALAVVVMYDAANVRWQAGEQARVLNFLLENLEEQLHPAWLTKELKELLGHTPLQVIAGGVLGMLIGYFGPEVLGVPIVA